MSRSDPWEQITRPYPAEAPRDERVRFLLNYALVAPSSHNTQPWLFRIAGPVIELRADRTRGLPVADPDDRELTLSCGAALLHLRVALEAHGWRPSVALLPDPGDPDLLARVGLDGPPTAAVDDPALLDAIAMRRTNRRAFEDREVPADVLGELEKAAQAEGAWLWVAPGAEAKAMVADLVAEGDRRQWAMPPFRRELAAWCHPNRSRSLDGMPGATQGLGDLASAVGPLIIRTFDLGRGAAAKDRELAEGSPALAVLWTDADEPVDRLRAGQALARVLLRARVHYVWASFLNQPVQCRELRPALADVVHGAHPQIVLRLGYGPDVATTPRRPVEDVLA